MERNVPWKNLCLERSENISKEECDTNLYRGLELVNEMKVLLISDPTTTYAGCTMSVNVGSFSDPDDLPGLAHLCERMLVLGSQKYPTCKGFYKFVTDNNGNYYGTTTADQTSFYFKINKTYFKDALQQYVHLFLTPLFKEEWMEAEINVIDFLHTKVTTDNFWISEFIKSTAKSNHPYSRFAFGDRTSLKTLPEARGINVRRRLLDFYNKYYSANIMSLCVISNESLNEIEEMVVNLFCMVENKNIKIPMHEAHPYKEQFCTTWYIIPTTDIKILKIVFPLPGVVEEYWMPAVNFIIMLLKYKGEGSLFASVNNPHLFRNIEIFREPCARDINFFVIEIHMTQNRLEYIESFIEMLFEYLNMIKNECNLMASSDHLLLKLYEIFIKQVTDYIDNTSKTFYNYESTYGIAAMLRLYPMEKILIKRRPGVLYDCAWECNQDVITWILNRYISPQNVRVYIFARDYEHETNRISPDWSGRIMYKEERIPEEIINRWQNISHSRFRLPSLEGFMMQYDPSLCDDN